MTSSLFHPVTIGGFNFNLPIREVAPGISIALFNPLGDWHVNEVAGAELAQLIYTTALCDAEVLLMADGKAQALLHVVGRVTRLPTVIARKEYKPYMTGGLSVDLKTITTGNVQQLHLDGDAVIALRGHDVVIVDDVVSTGSTIKALRKLLDEVSATYLGTVAVFTEGPTQHSSVAALAHLPLF